MTMLKRLGAVALGGVLVGSMFFANASADQTVTINNGNHRQLGWRGAVTGTGVAAEIGTKPATAEFPASRYIHTAPLGSGAFYAGTYATADTVELTNTNYDGMDPKRLIDAEFDQYRFSECSLNAGKKNSDPAYPGSYDGSDNWVSGATSPEIRISLQVVLWGPANSSQVGLPSPGQDDPTGLSQTERARLVYEPAYDSSAPARQFDTWQHFDAFTANGWWTTKNLGNISGTSGGPPASGSYTYAQLMAQVPADWYVKSINYKLGSGYSSPTCMAMDKMKIAVSDPMFPSATFDWENPLTTTTTALVRDANFANVALTSYDTTVDEFGRGLFEADLHKADLTGAPDLSAPVANQNIWFIRPDSRGTNFDRVLCLAVTDASGHAACVHDSRQFAPTLVGSTFKFRAYHYESSLYSAADSGLKDAAVQGFLF